MIRRIWRRALLVAGLFAGAASCTTADDMLGYDFIPDDQKMAVRHKLFDPTVDGRILTTRLYRTDSIISSNLGYGYFGLQNDATFGKRSAGFLTQYLVGGVTDSTGFGYRPIFDSVQLLMTISDYKGDTTIAHKYNVYEVTGDFTAGNASGDDEADSTFYVTFDPTPYISANPVFTFVFPDGKSSGPSSTSVRMTPTDEGMALIRRLMLMEGEYKDDMSVYKDDELWVKTFKGLYIVPDDSEAVEGEGSMFSMSLSESGFSIHGRNRYEEDPELVRDTTQAVYYFYDSSAEVGNLSVNTVRRDYSGSRLDGVSMLEPGEGEQDDRVPVEICYVEGMGGPVTEIRFDDNFFKSIEKLLTDTDPITGETTTYSRIAFNQAKVLIYIEGADYDWEAINPDEITDLLDNSLSRLGLYTNYKKLSAVSDYNYFYESQYSMELSYGGYLTRSWGCYTLDITSHVQYLWSLYREIEEAAEPDEDTLKALENQRTLYLGPEAYGLYGFGHSILQGMDGDADSDGVSNPAPIKVELTYTLMK